MNDSQASISGEQASHGFRNELRTFLLFHERFRGFDADGRAAKSAPLDRPSHSVLACDGLLVDALVATAINCELERRQFLQGASAQKKKPKQQCEGKLEGL